MIMKESLTILREKSNYVAGGYVIWRSNGPTSLVLAVESTRVTRLR